jgi:hypothetical protein
MMLTEEETATKQNTAIASHTPSSSQRTSVICRGFLPKKSLPFGSAYCRRLSSKHADFVLFRHCYSVLYVCWIYPASCLLPSPFRIQYCYELLTSYYSHVLSRVRRRLMFGPVSGIAYCSPLFDVQPNSLNS